MKRTKEDAALTRKLVLDAALKVFSRKGYSQATLEVIAKEARVTRGAIYWHFKNKFEMFVALLGDLYEKAIERIHRVLNSLEKPREKIHCLISELFTMFLNLEQFRIVEEVNIFRFEKRKELKAFFIKHQENVKGIRELIKDLILEGINAGEFDSRLDPDITAWALMSYLAGTKSAWLSGITDIYSGENAEKLTDIFINGIVKR
jgi:TetR/AcrR family acrAB operon transcriptional repressor